jgi:hypothetical protein
MIKENSSFLLLNRLEDGLGVTLYLRETGHCPYKRRIETSLD